MLAPERACSRWRSMADLVVGSDRVMDLSPSIARVGPMPAPAPSEARARSGLGVSDAPVTQEVQSEKLIGGFDDDEDRPGDQAQSEQESNS